jgi:hypothetical protein
MIIIRLKFYLIILLNLMKLRDYELIQVLDYNETYNEG